MKRQLRRPSVTSTHRKSYKYLITGLFLLAVIHTYGVVQTKKLPESAAEVHEQTIRVDTQHILNRHAHYSDMPCKSEFPTDWDDERIIATTKKIAANDNADWRQEDNGYYVTEDVVSGVKVRVVVDREESRVITSYPTNVERNPCPANDR